MVMRWPVGVRRCSDGGLVLAPAISSSFHRRLYGSPIKSERLQTSRRHLKKNNNQKLLAANRHAHHEQIKFNLRNYVFKKKSSRKAAKNPQNAVLICSDLCSGSSLLCFSNFFKELKCFFCPLKTSIAKEITALKQKKLKRY